MEHSNKDADDISELKKLASISLAPLWTQLKKMPRAVIELDSAMVELQLASKATAFELEHFYRQSNEIAKSLGISTSAVIQATADWTKLGYSIKDAQTLAKSSSILASISPGMDIKDAAKAIKNTMKAYGIEAGDTLDGIASKINIVGKSLALSNQDISTILASSASIMKSANTGLEETIALSSAAQSTIQDVVEVGNALNTVSARMQGLDGDSISLSDNLASLNKDIYELTNHQISIKFDDNTYKDIYTILDEISQIWEDLSATQRSGLLSELFSPEQANTGAAIIANFKQAREALALMKNSAGNAMAEMDAVYDSLEYKLNHLKETGVGIGRNLIDNDEMKTSIDLINTFTESIDFLTKQLGLFGTLAVAGSGFLGAKGLGLT